MSYTYQSPVFPTTYPMYVNPYQQTLAQQQAQQMVPVQSQQMLQQTQSNVQPQTRPQPAMQNGGFAFVRSEQEARDYPVAPGNYMTFKNEHAPYLYEKSKSFSQLDEPLFEKYRLVKESNDDQRAQQAQEDGVENDTDNSVAFALASDFVALSDEVKVLQEEIAALRAKLKETPEKKPAGKAKKDEKEDEEQ